MPGSCWNHSLGKWFVGEEGAAGKKWCRAAVNETRKEF
jgi:hypothetical protein